MSQLKPKLDEQIDSSMVEATAEEELLKRLEVISRRLESTPEDAEDTAGEAWFRTVIPLRRGAIDGGIAGVEKFAYRSAKNLSIDQSRRKARVDIRSVHSAEELEQFENLGRDPFEQACIRAQMDLLEQKGMRDFGLLVAFSEGATYQELADRLSITLKALKTRVHRAREACRKVLKEAGWNDHRS